MPEVSIIVPVYKVEPYLGKCVDSVLAQTYGNFECILVDDGSPDNCGKICDEYAAEDTRIKVIHQKNAGVSAARNAALDIASGKWIVFVDSDDWVEPDLLEKALSAAAKHDADIVQWNYFAEGGRKVQREDIYPDGELLINSDTKYPYGFTMIWRRMFSRQLIEKTGARFYRELIFAQDVPFNYLLVASAGKIWCINDCLYHYVCRENSSVNSMNLVRVKSKIDAAAKMEEVLINAGLEKKMKSAILQKKSGARNSLLLDLEKPEIKLWKQTFPEINSEIGKLGWKTGIIYYCTELHLDFLVLFFIRLYKKKVKKNFR